MAQYIFLFIHSLFQNIFILINLCQIIKNLFEILCFILFLYLLFFNTII